MVDDSNTFSDNAGDNPRAYRFLDANQSGLFWGAKGADDPRIRKVENDRPYYKKSQARNDMFILDVDTIKDDLSDALDTRWEKGKVQPDDFCNFPRPMDGLYSKSFFSQLTSEERQINKDRFGNPKGFKWMKKSSSAQNHFWDCRVYNVCAKQILYKETCKTLKISPSWEAFATYMGH